jgi:hypothetical protein
LKSFNFFNTADRKVSAFKIKSVVLDMVHHLHDWDLTTVRGQTLLETQAGKPVYTWSDSFSLLLQWIPIPELRTNLKADKDGFFIRD